MKITSVRHIDGPNVYLLKPVLIADIQLEDLTERESCEIPGFVDHLLQELPGLREHHCAKGQPGGFVERLHGGTFFGHIVEHVAIEMASLLGLDVHYGKTLYAGAAGVYEIVMECQAFNCQKHLLERARDGVEGLTRGQSPRFDEALQTAREILAREALGPSTEAIVRAARDRNIPVRRLNNGSLLQLGYGSKRRLVQATLTDATSAVAVDIASDKHMTKALLREAGVPVPWGGVASSAEEAVEWFRTIGQPVVLKPLYGNQGRGVSLNLQTEDEVRVCYDIANQISSRIVVERFIEGRNIRILVVAGKMVAASERIPAHVQGDGQHSVGQLVAMENENPLRGNHHELPLTKIPLDETTRWLLQRQGLGMDSVPASGQTVYLRDSANLSTGGEAMDITLSLHHRYRQFAERAARVLGLDVCGIDLVVKDISTFEPDSVIVEVNAAPGIRMHEHPSFGVSRDVGQAIVEALFPSPGDGRIPIVSITGTNGKTTTTRLIGHVLGRTSQRVGMTTTSGVYVGEEEIVSGDTTGPQSALMVLSDPAVDVAVLETARGGIMRGGLAYDQADVAVMTNISLDHIGQDFIETLDDLLHVKSLVAECVTANGTVVLNADDPMLVQLSHRLASKIAFFSAGETNSVLQRHLAQGGVGYWLSRGWLVEGRGNLRWEIAHVREIPLTMDGTARFQVENCLAACAVLRTLGVTRREIKAGLTSFEPATANPGRCNIFRLPKGAHIVLDYGHNPDGYRKVGDWLSQVPHGKLIGVIGVPGDRTNTLIEQTARVAAGIFDRIIVKEDKDKRGRKSGEVAAVMRDEIKSRCPDKPVYTVLSETAALQRAIDAMGEGDVAVVFYEHLAPLQSLVEQQGGTPVHQLAPERATAIAMR